MTNVSIQKAVFMLKSGFCIVIDDLMFFSTQTIDFDFLSNIFSKTINENSLEFCYTKKFFDFNINSLKNFNFTTSWDKYGSDNNFDVKTSDFLDFKKTSKSQTLALKLCVYAGLTPCVVSISMLNNKQNFIIEEIKKLYEPIYLKSDDVLNFDFDRFEDLKYISSAKVSNENSDNTYLYTFLSKTSGEIHYAITVNYNFDKNIINKNKQPTTIRIHSSCYTGDLMSSLRCDCKYQLHNAINILSRKKDGGIVIYLMQEGRGIGLANKLSAYQYQQNCLHNPFLFELKMFINLINSSKTNFINKSEILNIINYLENNKYQTLDTVDSNNVIGLEDDYRNFIPAKKILDFFNIESVNLITNNPLKVNFLTNLGIKVIDTINIKSPLNKHNKDYIKTKKQRMGHKGVV